MRMLPVLCLLPLLVSACAGTPREPAATAMPDTGAMDDPYRPGLVEVDEDPVRLSMPPPQYPNAARKAGVEGKVEVRVLVGRDGHVKRVVVVASVPELDAAAVEAVRQSRWKPAMKDKQPIEVWVICPVTFRLRG